MKAAMVRNMTTSGVEDGSLSAGAGRSAGQALYRLVPGPGGAQLTR
jgi:hypothetical protein